MVLGFILKTFLPQNSFATEITEITEGFKFKTLNEKANREESGLGEQG
jgi:hypothetical protein